MAGSDQDQSNQSRTDRSLGSTAKSRLFQWWAVFYEFCTAQKARELADTSDIPPFKWDRIGGMIVRAIPFLYPMFIHILFFVLLGFANTFLYTATGTIMADMWNNKLLAGEKLQPGQAWLFALDESFVRSDFLDSGPTYDEETGEELAPQDERLTVAQRRSVRNHMYFGYAILGLYGILQGFILGYYNLWIWQNVNHHLRVAMLDRLEYLSMSFHHQKRSGDAIYRIYQDSAMIVSVLDEAVISPVETIRGLAIAVWFVAFFDPWLLVAVFLVWLPGLVLTIWYTPRIRERSIANRVANSNLTSSTQEIFRASKLVKATRTEDLVLERFKRDSKTALNAAFYLRFDMVVLSLIVGLIGGLAIIGTEYLMVTWVLEERPTMFPAMAAAWVSFTLWNFGAFNSARERVGECIGTGKGLVRLWCMLQDLFIGLERAFYFLELKPGVEEKTTPKIYPTPVKSISWNNVNFAYPDGERVLDGVNLQAKVGTITAIVGSTGSGKSTMMSLLLRLYDPDEGTVLVNETDLRDLKLEHIRTHTSIALQKNILFTGKVRNNISYAIENASMEDIENAAKVACAHDFIQDMEQGYETLLGERGSKLSAGQRQRISIARAIIRNTPVLVLDEPTASLDARMEQRVLQNVSEWGRDKIVFIITHRLSTVRKADQIAFLEGGKIVESGSHDELMSIEGGSYRAFTEAELAASQQASGGGA